MGSGRPVIGVLEVWTNECCLTLKLRSIQCCLDIKGTNVIPHLVLSHPWGRRRGRYAHPPVLLRLLHCDRRRSRCIVLHAEVLAPHPTPGRRRRRIPGRRRGRAAATGARSAVEVSEGFCQDVADVGEVEQHQWDADDGVEDGGDLAGGGAGGDVAVA